jgi:hypothetical protein
VSSGLRFLIEVVAWIAGPWAVADAAGTAWAAVPTLLVLFGLPALFNTPGDKSSTVIAVAGPVRLLIELVLLAAAVVGAWAVWPPWAAAAVSIAGGLMVIAGMPRYRWLAAGAPPG